MAESLQPERLEIAHVQYYGWARKNFAALIPTRAQVLQSLWKRCAELNNVYSDVSVLTQSCPIITLDFQRLVWADGDAIKY